MRITGLRASEVARHFPPAEPVALDGKIMTDTEAARANLAAEIGQLRELRSLTHEEALHAGQRIGFWSLLAGAGTEAGQHGDCQGVIFTEPEAGG